MFTCCLLRKLNPHSSITVTYSKRLANKGLSRIYLAVSFLSVEETSSVVAVSWYTGAITEIVVHLALSNIKTLSLSDTHLSERMNLLTLIILGEGILRHVKRWSKYAKKPHRSNHHSPKHSDSCEEYILEEQR